MTIDRTGEPTAPDEAPWRFEVTAEVKATGERRLVGRASDRSSAQALIGSAKAQEIYRNVRLHDLRDEVIEEDFL